MKAALIIEFKMIIIQKSNYRVIHCAFVLILHPKVAQASKLKHLASNSIGN